MSEDDTNKLRLSYIETDVSKLNDNYEKTNDRIVDIEKNLIRAEERGQKTLGIVGLIYKVAVGILIVVGGTFAVNAWAAAKVMTKQGGIN